MPAKIKTISLSYPHLSRTSNDNYRVERITDALDFHPGQMLQRDTVEALCKSKEWRVVISPNKEPR